MSISLSESSLTQEQWDALTELVTGAQFQTILYQWDPAFTVQATGNSTAYDFDAVIWDDTIYRVTAEGASYLNAGVWDAVSGYAPATGQQADIPPSLVADTDLYVFAATATGISRRIYDGSWDSWTEIVTDSTVAFVAATGPSTVHFITYDETNFHYQFHVAINDGGWSVTDSDIYWGYPIWSFAAKRVGSRDALVITANIPGTPSARAVGTQVVKYVLPKGGLFVIPYQYGSWGDHREIDLVDQWSAYRYRQTVCLSEIDDTLWLTAYSSEGSKEAPVTGTRVYSSKDGLYWSHGELLPFGTELPLGVQLLALDDTLYGITRDQVFSSARTLWFGSPDETTILDVTPYVTEWRISRRDIQQAMLVISNPQNWIQSSILNGDHTLALLFLTGYSGIMIPTGIMEVDTLEPTQDKPVRAVQITARDRLAWLSSRTQSEQFRNWEPQVIGVDEYSDSTGTGYGGMTHTAPLRGSYYTENNLLGLRSNNAEGIAVSTYHYDEWNGAAESHFQLASLGNNEYAGLAFRLQDADNGYFYFYNQSDDKLYLIHRAAATDTTLWSSSAKSWSGGLGVHCLRVEFRYSRIRLYSGAPQGGSLGVQWSLEQSLLVDGQDPEDDPGVDAGYVGTRGKGYAPEDVWSNAPPTFPITVLPPDYQPYSYLIPWFDYD